MIAGPSTDEILVLPKIYKVNLLPRVGKTPPPAHARASLLAAAETEIDGLRPLARGLARLADPLAVIRPRRGADGARKLIPEADSRPLVVIDPRAPASPETLDAAVRAASCLPSTSPAVPAARC